MLNENAYCSISAHVEAYFVYIISLLVDVINTDIMFNKCTTAIRGKISKHTLKTQKVTQKLGCQNFHKWVSAIYLKRIKNLLKKYF